MIGIISDGNIQVSPNVRKKLIPLEGKFITFDIVKKNRSNSQNNYYWNYLRIISQETGENETDLHELFKRKFLIPEYKVVMGQEIKIPTTTTSLSKTDFSDYLDKISSFTAISLPSPEEAGYITGYKI